MSQHQVLIDALQAAERLLMYHGTTLIPTESEPELLDEGDTTLMIDGYKILRVKFKTLFDRPWTPGRQFVRWARKNYPELV